MRQVELWICQQALLMNDRATEWQCPWYVYRAFQCVMLPCRGCCMQVHELPGLPNDTLSQVPAMPELMQSSKVRPVSQELEAHQSEWGLLSTPWRWYAQGLRLWLTHHPHG